MEHLCCLDFEASALGERSYPIEAAVVDCATLKCQSWLIRPSPRWLSEGIWSAEAAGLHGIPMEELLANGNPISQVAAESGGVLPRQAGALRWWGARSAMAYNALCRGGAKCAVRAGGRRKFCPSTSRGNLPRGTCHAGLLRQRLPFTTPPRVGGCPRSCGEGSGSLGCLRRS